MTEATRYPGYDVLAKRRGPSWNEATRRVVEHRMAVPHEPRFLPPDLFRILDAVCARILPQPKDRPPVPLAALVDARLLDGPADGFRYASMPEAGEAWRRGLRALDAAGFLALDGAAQDALLRRLQSGDLEGGALGDMSGAQFFAHRVLPDITTAYYAHPTAWSEIGFGGPASPRGYVRLALNRRDPWEPVEARPGAEDAARRAHRDVR